MFWFRALGKFHSFVQRKSMWILVQILELSLRNVHFLTIMHIISGLAQQQLTHHGQESYKQSATDQPALSSSPQTFPTRRSRWARWPGSTGSTSPGSRTPSHTRPRIVYTLTYSDLITHQASNLCVIVSYNSLFTDPFKTENHTKVKPSEYYQAVSSSLCKPHSLILGSLAQYQIYQYRF